MSERMYDKIVTSLDGLETSYLRKVITQGLEQKALLNQILGHNEENDYRTIIPLNGSNQDFYRNNYQLCQNILCHTAGSIVDWDWVHNLCTDNRRNSLKITRLVAKELNAWRCSHPLRDFFHKYFDRDIDDASIVARLGEILMSSASGRSVIVSTNLFDFLTASGAYWNLAAFESCHNFKGIGSTDYFTGNVCYFTDSISLITYVAADHHLDRKLGRSWAVIPDERMLQLRTYGNFQEFERKVARELIQSRLSTHYGVSDYKRRKLEVGAYRCGRDGLPGFYHPTIGYVDAHTEWDYSYPTTKYDKDSPLPYLDFAGDTLCLSCGDWHDHEKMGLCRDCYDDSDHYDYYCERCGDGLCEDEVYYGTDDQPYCDRCWSLRYNYCDRCGDTTDRDDLTWSEVLQEDLCSYCRDKYCDFCAECDEEIDPDNCIRIDGNYLCSDCTDEKTFECGHCGERVYNSEANETEDGDVCEHCYSSHYGECVECCGNVLKSTLVQVEDTGEWVCESCLHAYFACEECGKVFSELNNGRCVTCDAATTQAYQLHIESTVYRLAA